MTQEETLSTMADALIEVKKENNIDQNSEQTEKSLPLQTSNHQDNEEEETDNIPSHTSRSDHNSMTSDAPLSRTSKFPELRTNLETRSKALNMAWTELNSLLYEYKAELLIAENHPRKFDNVTDLDELKSQLVEKENENIQLQQQCESLQRASEQNTMDLSIKDSLLKKYQDDLLQKETSLIHANTKVCKLESRLRMLESNESSGPPRKMMRTMTPGRVPHFSRRMDVSGLVKTSALMGKFLPKRHKPAPASHKQVAPTPSTQPSTSTQPPIVCIEVEDDDVITDVTQAAQSVSQQEQDTMFIESYTDNSYRPENSSFQDDSNAGENVTDYDDSFNQSGEYSGLEESGLEQGLEPSVQGALEQGWDQIQVPQIRHQQRQGQATNKPEDRTCAHCGRLFSHKANRDAHIRVVHLKIKRFQCETCGRKFSRRSNLRIHTCQGKWNP